MKKNAPEDLKEKVYDGEIKTNKEYQGLKRQSELFPRCNDMGKFPTLGRL